MELSNAMGVEQWFKEKCDYATGVKLYASLPKSNKNIVRRLMQSETGRNRATLKYELGKLNNRNIQISISQKKASSLPTKEDTLDSSIQTALIHSNGKITMAMLPNAKLRQRFVEKNQAFYNRWELKRKLNELRDEQEEEALALIVEIMKLTKFIDAVWFEIDYYLEYKKLLPTSTKDFSKLSAMGKLKERQKLWSKKSKREATLKKWKSEICQIKDKRKKNLMEAKIKKQKETLNQISIELNALNNLIDGAS